MSERLECDVAIIGGSMGGVAAALASLEAGCKVVLTEATDWLGGQMTAQGVSALDEHLYIETFGGTRRYYDLRERIRAHYRDLYDVEPVADGPPLNPGNGWVSRLCFEPRVGEQVLREMLEPYLFRKTLTILTRHRPVKAVVENDTVEAVTLRGPKNAEVTLAASYFLDATDLGDLLPLTGAAYVMGAESQDDTGEPHAKPGAAAPDEVQSFTYGFVVEYCPGEEHTIAKPEGYEHFRDAQPYALHLNVGQENETHFKMFERGERGELPFWTYRRIFDADPLGEGRDLALINWAGNDYRFANLIDKPKTEQRRVLNEAKRLALGFLYWLQTECPRDGGGFGYPELKLRKDVMGTRDGLSRDPYVRESRRIKALERITENDIVAAPGRGARARHHPNSVGVGWYQMDLHPSVGNDEVTMFEPTLPFQIPLGALIPETTRNLLAACKNIGTTHLSNGAYRLHPFEWAVGEAAGTLAAFCLEHGKTPRQVWASETLTRQLQDQLLAHGVPLAWAVDVPLEHSLFAAAQRFVLAGGVTPASERFAGLELNLDAPFSPAERDVLAAVGTPIPHTVTSLGDLLEGVKT
ncbi:FAD-dependent oxidoreductase [soil metagenome]